MDILALRCLTVYEDEPNLRNNVWTKKPNSNNNIVLALDAETTTDKYQNLLYGSCGVWIDKQEVGFYIFYAEYLTKAQVNTIKAYATSKGYEALPLKDFLSKIFYPYVYTSRAICIGFNLPFDLSRLARDYTYSKALENGFSFKLLDDPFYSNIIIQHRNSNSSRIRFTNKTTINNKAFYPGYFLDLKTFTFALTDKSKKLAGAAKVFGVEDKTETDDLGKVTLDSLAYNEHDVRITYDLYLKEMDRYQLYGLRQVKEPNQLYSPAGIGKAYLEKRGVKPFRVKNPDFPKELLAKVMTTYYGGRTEVRIRKQPIPVTYLDFTSMYPSVYTLLGMEAFLLSDTICYRESTNETQEFLDKIRPEDIRNKDTWKKLNRICRIKPDNDILPVRSKYGDKNTFTIGLPYLSSVDASLYYTLSDLLASKFLTGKTPIIEEAITFYPVGVQDGLKEIEILPGIHLKPGDEFIKTLIEERTRIKRERDTKTEKTEYDELDIKQNILKIIANSTSYGIFIELNPKKVDKQTIVVHGLTRFEKEVEKVEAFGKYYNPIMAVFITASSRLILATTEALLDQNGGYLAYCDTDSVFVSPKHVKMIQELFKPLNPYDVDVKMFKIEDDEPEEGENRKKAPLDNVWFYGISAKRYVLYDMPNVDKYIIRKYSLHGLGYIQGIRNKQKQVWEDILRIHYHPEQKDEILEKYEGMYSISQLTISGYDIYKRFTAINHNKGELRPIKEQIKPFNFITVGNGYKKDSITNEPINPMVPYVSPKDKQFEQIPFKEFMDYHTGKSYTENTKFYWKPMPEVIDSYIRHPESKFDGDTGRLQRKHLIINKNSIKYIGKESNNLSESEVLGVDPDNYTVYEDTDEINKNITDRILNMSEAEALALRINPLILSRAKTRIRKTGNLGRSKIKEILLENSSLDTSGLRVK